MTFEQDGEKGVARDSVDARAHERQRLVADVRHFCAGSSAATAPTSARAKMTWRI